MNLKWFLGLSVLLNVVLAVAFAFHSPRPTDQTVAPAATPGGSPASELVRPSANGKWDPDPPGIKTMKPKGTNAPAANVEVDDYPVFIKKLRAAGFSKDTIATLVVAEMLDRGIGDNIALQRKLTRGELTQEEFQKQSRQMQKDYETALEGLLGKGEFRRYQINHDYQLRQLAATGNFTPETIEKYYDLRKVQQEQMNALTDKYQALGIDPVNYADQEYELKKAYQEELNKALGSEAAAKIRAETDWHLTHLRRQMSAVKISDDEYAQIGQVLQNYQQEQQRLSAMQRRGDLAAQDASTQTQALEQQKKDQLMALFGPQRYAEYEKQNDGTFRQLKQFGRPNGLNDEQVDYVYQVVKNQRAQQEELRKQREAKQLKREDYSAAVEQVTADTRNTLQRFLGADRYERLKRSTGQVP